MDEQPLAVRVLGVAGATRGEEVIDIASARQRAILATLAAFEGRPVSPDTLIDVVWGEELPASPQGALHTHMSRLRELLGADAVVTAPTGYALAVEREQIDAWEFAARVEAAGRNEPVACADELTAALELWRGPAFAEIADRPAVQPIAVRLDELAVRAGEARAEVLLAGGTVDEALGAASALVADHPLRERPLVVLMTALARAGRHSEALARYDEHRRLLAGELGLSPSPVLVELQRAILTHDLPRVAPGAVSTHADAAPAIGRRGNLPYLPITALVGRRDERRRLDDTMSTARVVTITGPGGVGKTRLALHVAHDLVDRYPDGAWWCDLATLATGAEEADIATTVAVALGLDDRVGGTVLDRVASYLATRRALVVFDNCEHVVVAAAEVIDRLVRSSSELVVLATSREALAIDGEHRLRLDPLPAPLSDEVSDAVLLFLERVRAVNPEATTDGPAWDAVLEICRTLDGLPLALEFAAAQVAHLAIAEIAAQLDRRFDLLAAARPNDRRHASLLTTLDWSYALLDAHDQEVLDALAVFAGPFTIADAQRLWALAPGGHDEAAVSAAVGTLVDKSLLAVHEQRQTTRYRLLDTVRAYCREHLAVAGSLRDWRHRHSQYVLELAERADRGLRGPDEAEWVRTLDEHLGDLRAAHATLAAERDVDGLVRLCTRLKWYADPRSRPVVQRWASDLVAVARQQLVDHPLVPRLLAMAAMTAIARGDLDTAEQLAEEADVAGDGALGDGLGMLARVDLFRGRLDAARRHGRTAAARARVAGERHAAAVAATSEVIALAFGGPADEAARAADDLIAAAADVGSPSLQAMAQYCAAEVVIDDREVATAHLNRAVVLARVAAADFFEGLAITTLAGLEMRGARPDAAFARLRDCIDHWERSGLWKQQWWLTLRRLIEALGAAEQHVPVLTLAAAFEASPTTGAAYGVDADRLALAVERAVAAVTPEDRALAERAGAELDDEAALAFGRRILDEMLAGNAVKGS